MVKQVAQIGTAPTGEKVVSHFVALPQPEDQHRGYSTEGRHTGSANHLIGGTGATPTTSNLQYRPQATTE